MVATREAELPALAELERRGKANGLTGLRRLTADSLDSADLMLNGVVLRDDNGTLPDLSPDSIGKRPADLPPRSIAFIVFPDAEAASCQE